MIAALLATAILLGGMPLVAGIAPQHSRPAFNLDICHPIQPTCTVSAGCSLPTLVANTVTFDLQEFGSTPVPSILVAALAAEAPDPPPPESIN